MQTQVKLAERRTSDRQSCDKPAFVMLSTRQRIACHVVNISSSGALLAFGDAIVLPPRFSLLIPDDLFQAECDLRHTNGNLIGVQFASHLAEAFARYNSVRTRG